MDFLKEQVVFCFVFNDLLIYCKGFLVIGLRMRLFVVCCVLFAKRCLTEKNNGFVAASPFFSPRNVGNQKASHLSLS